LPRLLGGIITLAPGTNETPGLKRLFTTWLSEPTEFTVPIKKHISRFAGGTFLGIGVLGTSAAAILGAAHPATAAAVLAAVQNAVTCATTGTTPCVSVTNTSSGIGSLGASNTGAGVRGTSNSNNGVKGSSKTNYGVFGTSTSGFAGVAGTTANVQGAGVYGYNTAASGDGVFGSAPHGRGVFGLTTDFVGLSGAAQAMGTGVEGLSTSGEGVLAVSDSGTALLADSGTGSAMIAHSTGNFVVIARGPASAAAFPLLLENNNGHTTFFVDGLGNLFTHGSLQSFARTAGGATVTSFSPKTTLPTVEDTGTAQLVGGAAMVRLDPVFAASIEPRTGYRVFLTPDGETNGLFVATKTANGFIVRESKGGRTTVSFDYRVVATALGQAGQRMAVMSGAFGPTRPSLPVINGRGRPDSHLTFTGDKVCLQSAAA
jgi:hypothetical protein